MNRMRTSALIVTVAVVSVLLFRWQMWGESAATASPAQRFADAVAELSADDGAVVAVVDGVAVPEAKVRAFLVFYSARTGVAGSELPWASIAEYVDMLIENELMFQEADRRGLVPSDEDVLSQARMQKEGLLEFMRQDTGDARELRALFDQVRGTLYHVDVYDSSPVMLDGMRRTMAIGLLRNELMQAFPDEVRNDPAKREASFKAYAAELRAAADVNVLLK